MEIEPQGGPLYEYFKLKVGELRSKSPIEAQNLGGEIMLWASAVSAANPSIQTTWEAIKNQIEYKRQVMKNGEKTPTGEHVLDEIFADTKDGKTPTADIIMGRLQIG